VEQRGGEAGFALVGQPCQQRQQVERAVVAEDEAVLHRLNLAVLRRLTFIEHRRLAFVGGDLAQAGESRRGVEPAAAARRRRRVCIAAEHHGDGAGGALLRESFLDLAAAPQREERRRGHAPGFARRLVAAGQRQRTQVAKAGEAFVVHLQQFAAPAALVGAHADAVEGEAEQRPRGAMLRRHRGDVGVVVLHGDGFQAAAAREVGGEACAVEIRVQVVGDQLRLDFQQLHHALRGLLQRAAGRRVVEVADVLGEEGLVAAREADRILEEAAGGEDGGAGFWQLDGLRREASGAADELDACPLTPALSPACGGEGVN